MCSFMEILCLISNNISGDIDIPTSIAECYACKNSITKINNINDCDSLRILMLHYNKFTEIPNFPSHSHLEELSMAYNNISDDCMSIPIYISKLDLSHNNISNIDCLISGYYDNLTSLDVSYNNISKISNIHGTKQLEMLDLRHNPITSSKITKKTHNRIRTIYCNYDNCDSSDYEDGSESEYCDSSYDNGW